jgi:hypothetical protein
MGFSPYATRRMPCGVILSFFRNEDRTGMLVQAYSHIGGICSVAFHQSFALNLGSGFRNPRIQ